LDDRAFFASAFTGGIEMKRWMVETRATVNRTYFVDAEDAKGAEEASSIAAPDLDEDYGEETLSITEVPTSDDQSCPQESE
jgi:hypothetical protein